MLELPDPKSPLDKNEQLVFGVDGCRHPLLGCPLGHGNGKPEDQASNFLRSLLTSGQATQNEFVDLSRQLLAWEESNSVVMPPAIGDTMRPYSR
jgi:hypothetical protein